MSDTKARNIAMHHGIVTRDDRERLLGQRGGAVWLTGLSGSGKSTIARELERRLVGAGRIVYVLDGDNIRHGLNKDLGFSAEDREENIRRISEVSALFVDAGIIVLVAFISPYRKDRDQARATIGSDRFVEVFLDTPIATCEERDPKGLYQKARAGEIPEFTGISAPYEPPLAAELTLDTSSLDLDSCVDQLLEHLASRAMIPDGASGVGDEKR